MDFWKDLEKGIENELESSRVYRTAKNMGTYLDEQLHVREKVQSSQVYQTVNAVKNHVEGQVRAQTNRAQNQSQPDNTSSGSAASVPRGDTGSYGAASEYPQSAPPVYEAKARTVKPAKKKTPEPPEGMRAVRKKSPAPFYTVGVVWVLYALLFPLYTWYQVLLVAALSVLLGWISSKIFRGAVTYVPIEPEPEQPEQPAVHTGDPEVDRMIAEGYAYLQQLRLANDAIEDETLSAEMDRMEETCRKIFDFVAENPKKSRQIHRFMQYYLPVTLKLLNSYYKLSRQGIEGENISTTMFHIEGMMHTIVIAFEKQLDALFQDEALDISTDITVLEGMLRQEGLLDETEQKEDPHGRD